MGTPMDKYASLTPESYAILKEKHTEPPFTVDIKTIPERGTFICRGCGMALFRAHHEFISGCGWPSFDDEIPHRIKRQADADGRRTEILCARCDGHLGHVFEGEGHTAKNLRHCVNSLAIEFVQDNEVMDTEEAIIAAGCFWGVEYYFEKLAGVIATQVGYSGGATSNPTYEDVCRGNTHHLEVLRVIYDKDKLTYEQVIKYFFEIHNFTQDNGQGPDIGEQYLSAIFYFNPSQRDTAEQVIKILKEKGYQVTTQLRKVTHFWSAEEYHQHYYDKMQKSPYCHRHNKIF
ncbi:MAG: bifunctional methionine sulfoxide reductase B/A protein [Legionellales bacterium]|nr:bifunctional methionine sulfoxide reductase B/A protein [Legionellales bacterium]